MREMYIKPYKPDAVVRIPERGGIVMPAHGAKVKMSPHWHKRLRDESVVEITAAEFEQADKKFHEAAQAEARKANDEATKAQKKPADKPTKTATAATDKKEQ